MKGEYMLAGAKIIGGNPEAPRVEHDFYATNPQAVHMLLDAADFELIGDNILEPCVGNGNIANVIKERFFDTKTVTGVDIVDRGYPETIVTDFLNWNTDKKFDAVITNPPFKYAEEFVRKSLEMVNAGSQVVMFLKINFLEGVKRKDLFDHYPPKYIYVFRNRMATWNNGQELDPKTGKRWASTMCYAWYIWEKGSVSEPVIRWL